MSEEPAKDRESSGINCRLGGRILAVSVFTIGFINFPLRVVGWQFDYLPGDAIDNRLNNYILEHGYRYLTGREDSFWDAPFFYPVRGAAAQSDAHLGMLPIYSALRSVGFSPESAFQGWFIIPFALNFATAAWALRQLGAGWVGSALGAYLFAFGIPLAGQLIHSQLYPRFFVPPAVVYGWEFLRSPRTSRLAACLGCVACQIYLSVYIGFFLVLLLATGIVLSVLRFRSQLPWHELLRPGTKVWLARMAVLLGAGLTLSPLAFAHARTIGPVERDLIRSMAPRPNAWFRPSAIAAVFPGVTDPHSEMEQEHQLFPGFTAVLAIGIGLASLFGPAQFGSRRSTLEIAACSTLALMLLVTVSFEMWPYGAIVGLPGGNNMRAIARIVLVLLFPMAIAVASVVDGIVATAERLGKKGVIVAAIVTVGIGVAEQWLGSTDGSQSSVWKTVRYPRIEPIARQNQLKEIIRGHPHPAMIYVYPSFAPPGENPVILQLLVMRVSQDLGIPCVNGYSGYFPLGWDFFSNRGDLMNWLEPFQLPPDRLNGLVLIGEPSVKP